jgi:type I restriction enzyme S subunit
MMIPWLGEYSGPSIAVKRSFDVLLGKMVQPSPATDVDVDVEYFNSASVQWNGIEENPSKKMWASPPEIPKLSVRSGDLLICEGGDVGRAAIYSGEPGRIFQNSVHRARSRQGSDIRYLKYLLISLHGSGWLDILCNKATIAHFTVEKLGSLEIPDIPTEKQRRIADFLDAETARIGSLMTTQRQARTVLLERRAANVFAAVTGSEIVERMPPKLAWADSLPATWRSVKLGHFARMGSGHTPSRAHPEWWEDCTIPWITTGEVSQIRDDRREILTETREWISEIGLDNSAAELHPKGTVVLCRTAASAGYSAVMGEDMATSQDIVTWTCGPKLDPFYLLWCLRAMRADLLGRLAMGSTHKTIYMPDLQALRIPLPPIVEQHQIVADIRASNTTVDAAVDALDRQAALLAERRQALITAAVTGGISV